MAFPVTPSSGYPQTSGTYIPEIWSTTLVRKFYDTTVLGAITNRIYEGEIKKFGDTVNIRQIPEITVRPYTKALNLTVETPVAPIIQLLIDKGDYFCTIIDDVDKVQQDIGLMSLWSDDAAQQLKLTIERLILPAIVGDVPAVNQGNAAGKISQNIDLGSQATPLALTVDNIVEWMVDMNTILDEQNTPNDNRWCVVTDKIYNMLKKSKLIDASLTGDGKSVIRRTDDWVGTVDRFNIYRSHNLLRTPGASGAAAKDTVLFGHTYGVSFASQLTEMETLRSTTTFGTLMRGLQVYGWKTIKPEVIGASVVTA